MAWDRKRKDEGGKRGRPWRRLRAAILLRDGYLCQCEQCARRAIPYPADEVDHIIPRSKGGSDHPSNLRAIRSDPCHKAKSLKESGVTVKAGVQVDGWPGVP